MSSTADPVTESFAWVAQLGITIDLRLDAFALVMVALVSGIGLLICIYSLGYFSHDKPGLARLAGVLTLFAGAMLGVVLSDQLIALFIFWELTSVTSYLLIGNDDTNPRARAAALQAIFITGAGGLAMLAGLIIIGQAGGTYRISELLVDPPTRRRGQCRPRARADRCVHQVGAGAVQQLAAGGDGRADPGERLPALGHDGEGGRLPGGAPGADVRTHRQLAGARA